MLILRQNPFLLLGFQQDSFMEIVMLGGIKENDGGVEFNYNMFDIF
jgi:hypothetical protein